MTWGKFGQPCMHAATLPASKHKKAIKSNSQKPPNSNSSYMGNGLQALTYGQASEIITRMLAEMTSCTRS